MTDAETIARLFNNDGQLFDEPECGHRIEQVCEDWEPVRIDKSNPHDVRYVFEDGSWLAIVGDMWFTDEDADGENCYWPRD